MIPLSFAAAAPVLLAHQGGWDEILLIGGPILIIMALLRLAKRRLDSVSVVSDTEDPVVAHPEVPDPAVTSADDTGVD